MAIEDKLRAIIETMSVSDDSGHRIIGQILHQNIRFVSNDKMIDVLRETTSELAGALSHFDKVWEQSVDYTNEK